MSRLSLAFFSAVRAGGVGPPGFTAVFGIKHQVVVDLLIDVFRVGIPEQPLGDGLQVDRHGVKHGPPVFGHGFLDPPAVMHHKGPGAALFFEDVFFDGVEIKTAGQLQIVFLGHG